MLLPTHCPVCRTVGPAPCRRCVAELRPAPEWSPTEDLAEAVALFAHDGVGRELVLQLKFANHRDAVSSLGAALARVCASLGSFDAVCWVPTTRRRRSSRGFDQARLVAVSVGHGLGRPPSALLDRCEQRPQAGLDRDHRHGVRFRARRHVGGSVLVVDDVRTTGASLSAAAVALREAGAARVVGATLSARA